MNEIARVANLLGAAALAVTDRMLDVAPAAGDTSVSGAAALVRLDRDPGLGVTELGQRIRLSQPQAGRLADLLVSRGLVERRPGRSGRSVALHLTSEGRATVRRMLAARERELGSLIATLDGEERAVLERSLEGLLDRIYEEIGSPWVMCRLCDEGACLATDAPCPVAQAWRERGDAPDATTARR